MKTHKLNSILIELFCFYLDLFFSFSIADDDARYNYLDYERGEVIH